MQFNEKYDKNKDSFPVLLFYHVNVQYREFKDTFDFVLIPFCFPLEKYFVLNLWFDLVIQIFKRKKKFI